ncbi:MAG: sigma-70 family RNA polymerase sigma factor [Lachnospiraceae bacterium]|nr:sigma-70 family RNA polymerase sigma factor [Lachnospiraceae bacterium]
MEDRNIIELYWARDERAIAESQNKYGGLCTHIALRFLGVREDAEECLNDALQAAWNAIPPERPEKLGAWLSRVTRNLAVSRYRRDHAARRGTETDVMLSELEDCIPSGESVEGAAEAAELSRTIDAWLRTLDKTDRVAFLRRYYAGESLTEVAEVAGQTPAAMAKRMFRLRAGLRTFLEKEGVAL